MSEPEGKPDSTEPQIPHHKTVKENLIIIGEKGKAFGVNWFIGTAAILSLSVLGVIGSSIGVQQINLRTIGSPSDLILILSQLNFQTALFMVFSAAAVGAVLMFWIISANSVSKLVHMHKVAEYTNEQIRKDIVSDLRKLRILPAATFGVFLGIMILTVSGGVYTLTGINTLNAHSLINAYMSGHYLVILIIIAGGAINGAIMQHFKGDYKKTYDKIEAKIPKGLNKIF